MAGVVDPADGDVDPDVLEHVGHLAEELVDALEALGQEAVDAVFDGVAVAHVVDGHVVAGLADALDAAFALFESGGVPGQVEVDEGAQALEVESLAGGFGADDDEAEASVADSEGPAAVGVPGRVNLGKPCRGPSQEEFGQFMVVDGVSVWWVGDPKVACCTSEPRALA